MTSIVENDTLARIGTSCLQQLLEKNVKKLSPARWERITTTFVKLFKTTTPHQLFDEGLRADIDGTPPDLSDGEIVKPLVRFVGVADGVTTDPNGQAILPAPLSPNGDSPPRDSKSSALDRRRIFKQIIVKCVLQLLLIEMTNDLLHNEQVYMTIPPEHLLRLMEVLDHSYQFARLFNEDKELRTGLWKVGQSCIVLNAFLQGGAHNHIGFMKHLPNFLKQESSSAATLVNVLLRMYYDPRPEHEAARPQVADRFLSLVLLSPYIEGSTNSPNRLGLGVVQD